MTKSTETGLMEVINFFTGNKAKIEAAAEKAAAEESSPEEIVKKLIKKAEAAAAAEEKAAAATKEEIENRLVIGAEEIKTLEVGQVDSIVYLKKLKTTLKRLQNESTSGNYKAPPSHETILKGSIKTTENQIKICKSKITQATQKITKDLMEITERQANSDPVQTYINTLKIKSYRNEYKEVDLQIDLIDERLEFLLDSLNESEKIIEEFVAKKESECIKFKKDFDDLYGVEVCPKILESAAEPLNDLLAEFNEAGYEEFRSIKEIDDFKEYLKNVVECVNEDVESNAWNLDTEGRLDENGFLVS
jgi:hypothetical protein